MTLEILTSDLLSPVRHGFFTRTGGVSEGIYKGLNVGLGSDDNREHVIENRTRVANTLGTRESHLLTVCFHKKESYGQNDKILRSHSSRDATVTSIVRTCLLIPVSVRSLSFRHS